MTTTSAAIVLFASGFGSLICYFWYQSLQSYRRLNKARYAILNQIESALPVRMYLDEWRYLKREKPDPEIVEPRPDEDPDHRSHTIVEQWFVRLLAAGYLTIGGYAGGFILTPLLTGAGYSLPSPTTVGLIIGATVMVGSIGLFWIRS
ncbi:RipA family octameric membrane protein [Halorussus vallis]|uniref:RipA family octameric membrane protein n=1 Tax=Halorussus vallis TaxID=2953749 RepID=UPI003F5E0E02